MSGVPNLKAIGEQNQCILQQAVEQSLVLDFPGRKNEPTRAILQNLLKSKEGLSREDVRAITGSAASVVLRMNERLERHGALFGHLTGWNATLSRDGAITLDSTKSIFQPRTKGLPQSPPLPFFAEITPSIRAEISEVIGAPLAALPPADAWAIICSNTLTRTVDPKERKYLQLMLETAHRNLAVRNHIPLAEADLSKKRIANLATEIRRDPRRHGFIIESIRTTEESEPFKAMFFVEEGERAEIDYTLPFDLQEAKNRIQSHFSGPHAKFLTEIARKQESIPSSQKNAEEQSGLNRQEANNLIDEINENKEKYGFKIAAKNRRTATKSKLKIVLLGKAENSQEKLSANTIQRWAELDERLGVKEQKVENNASDQFTDRIEQNKHVFQNSVRYDMAMILANERMQEYPAWITLQTIASRLGITSPTGLSINIKLLGMELHDLGIVLQKDGGSPNGYKIEWLEKLAPVAAGAQARNQVVAPSRTSEESSHHKLLIENRRLRAQLEELKEAKALLELLNQIRANVRNAGEKSRELQALQADTSLQIEEVQQALGKKVKALTEKQSEIAATQSELEKLRTKNRSFATKIGVKKRTLKQTEEEVEQLKTEKEKLSEALRNASSKINEAEQISASLSSQKTELKEIELRLQNISAQLTAAQTEKAALETELEALRTTTEEEREKQLSETIKAQLEELRALKAAITEKATELEEIDGRLTSKSQELERIEDRTRTLESIRDQAISELATAQESSARAEDALTKAQQAKETALSSTRTTLSRLLAEADRANEQIEALRGRLIEMRRERDSERDKIKRAKAQLQTLEEKISEAESSVRMQIGSQDNDFEKAAEARYELYETAEKMGVDLSTPFSNQALNKGKTPVYMVSKKSRSWHKCKTFFGREPGPNEVLVAFIDHTGENFQFLILPQA